MKQAIIFKKGELRVEERKIPPLSRGKVLIKVCFCGLCATDVSILEGKFPREFPYFPGHECTGIVEKVGEGVTTLKKGDRVVCIPMANPCGRCIFCREGKDQFCVNRTKQELGGFAEYLAAEEKKIYPLPEDITLELGTLVEPLSIAIHAIDLADIRAGDSVLIIGGGAIGLLLLELVLVSGTKMVILSEPDEKRRNLARKLGADVVVNPNRENLLEIIKSCTQNLGVDVAFEAVGRAETCEQAIELVKKGGKVIFVGVVPPEKQIKLKPFEVFSKELVIKGVGINFHTYNRAINLIKRLNLEPLTTHKFDLIDIHKAIECFKKREGIKILIRC